MAANKGGRPGISGIYVTSQRKEPEVTEYITVSSIRAIPETVWKVLADATGYAEWNSEISSALRAHLERQQGSQPT